MNSFPAHRHLSRRTHSLLPLAGQLFQPTCCNGTKVEQKIKSRNDKQAAYYDRGAKV